MLSSANRASAHSDADCILSLALCSPWLLLFLYEFCRTLPVCILYGRFAALPIPSFGVANADAGTRRYLAGIAVGEPVALPDDFTLVSEPTFAHVAAIVHIGEAWVKAAKLPLESVMARFAIGLLSPGNRPFGNKHEMKRKLMSIGGRFVRNGELNVDSPKFHKPFTRWGRSNLKRNRRQGPQPSAVSSGPVICT